MKSRESIKCCKMMLEMFMRSLINAKRFWKVSKLRACKVKKKWREKQIKIMHQEKFKELGEKCRKVMNLT